MITGTNTNDDDTENMSAKILQIETAEQKKKRLKNNGGIREATLNVLNGPEFEKYRGGVRIDGVFRKWKEGDAALERQIYLHKYGPDSLNLPEDKRAIQNYRRKFHGIVANRFAS